MTVTPDIPAVRSTTLAPWSWNKQLFASACKELVPEHMVDLKDYLSITEPASLYHFWPLAKRTLQPFSVLLPAEVGTWIWGGGCGVGLGEGAGRGLVVKP